MALAFYFWR